jgi:uncharacterized protein
VNIVDANVLLYAVNEADPKHDVSRRWLDGALSAAEPVGFGWIVILAFLRLSTKVGLFPHPLELPEALATVRLWLAAAPSVILEPTPRHFEVFASLIGETGAGGNLTSDAHLATLAVELDAVVVTFDSDFERFAGVRRQEPVIRDR